jgi:putative NIF3 family GTP cyclohydrolase 1 type 2
MMAAEYSDGVLLDEVVEALDDYFRTRQVRGDAKWLQNVYDGQGAGYVHEFLDPGYVGRSQNGLMVRGGGEVERAATCVFVSDAVVAQIQPRTLLFAEHPVDLVDEPGFLPLARESFERLRELGSSFYHVHAPLDQHPDVAPSWLIARALGLRDPEDYFPIAEGIPGGAAVVGDSELSVDELATRLGEFLGSEIPIRILSRYREEAGRVAVVGGGGGSKEILEASLERGAQTYVTGHVHTRCRLDFVQEEVRQFREAAEAGRVSIVDGTHYGTEKPPQLAMVEWFRKLGLPADFVPDGPK